MRAAKAQTSRIQTDRSGPASATPTPPRMTRIVSNGIANFRPTNVVRWEFESAATTISPHRSDGKFANRTANSEKGPTMNTDPIWFDSSRQMSFGFMLPVREGTMGGKTPRFTDHVSMSRLARDVGFEGLWVADHLTHPHDDGTIGSWEAWTLMSALANAVPDIQIGPLVTCVGFRNPGLIAKMTEMINEISDGRFILGMGAGWNKDEYDRFGFPFDYRASRFEESIEIVHGLLRNGEATLDGEF